MLGGYAGKILFVNLSNGFINEEVLPEQICREFVGGYGLGIRVLYERMKPHVDPLGKDNMLGIVTGVLTGTSVPGSGRYGVVTKSPLTGAWSESNAGGTFGPELKTAGYDAIFFSGASPRAVYLLIKEGRAELRDASHLWGKDTYETEKCIQNETGDSKLKVACIGPAGEAKSFLAGIVNEKGRIAARGGAGAVMGSKNLKAVAIKGGMRNIGIARREKLKEAQARFLSIIRASDFAKGLTAAGTGSALSFLVSIGDSPVKNWRLTGTDSMPTVAKLDSGNMDKYKKSGYACQACPIRCGAIIEQRSGPFAIADEMHRPEYESLAALGSLLMNDNLEAVIKANDLCNRYGIDTISAGTAIAMAMECYENGLITKEDTGGMELTWGNAEAIVDLTEKIAKREGFGAVLADGPTIAAERIGKGADKYAVAVRGKGLPFHDARMSPAGGTAFIADANPGHHMNSSVTGMLENGAQAGTAAALQVPKMEAFADFDKKGAVYAIGFAYHQLLDDAGMCALYTVNTTPPDLAELISGVTGWDFEWEEALKAARRVLTLRQAFNAREGITPDQFDLPKRIEKEPLPMKTGAPPKIDYQALKTGYFAAMGWDIKTGMPSEKTLVDLGLAELTRDLFRAQK
ncbi:MAG TPA: aldehyde ferredoxin oxidoreductase family protein [Acidobacteriota bacterium]|nr:aldehyde ferredoxin oxidoreductase family protein [Acidobacteriota bacterium]